MATSQLWSVALNSSVLAASPSPLSPLLPDHHIAAYGRLQQQQQQEEAEEMYQEEEEECVITHIVHGSDAQEPEANFLLCQNCEQEEEEQQQQENYHERMGFPQTFLVLQDVKEKKNVGVVVDLEMEKEEEEEEQACVYMVVDYGLHEVEEDSVRFPELESRLVGWKQQQQQQQQGYCEEEQEEMASVVLDQEKGRWLLQPKKNCDADAQFAEVAELKPFLQAYMAANSGGLYSGDVEDDVYNHPSQQQIINNADATAAAAPQERSSSAMELEEDVSLYAQLGMRDGIAIGFEDEAGRHQRGDHARASQEEAEQQEQETCLSVVVQQQQQPSTALSVFHEIAGTTLALEEHSQQIAFSVTPLSTRPPPSSSSSSSSAASLEVVEVGKELTLREPSWGGENPCLLTASAMFTGWQNFERIGSSSEPLKQITDGSSSGGRGEEDYEWGHFDPSDWVSFSSSQSKNPPPLLLCGKKGSVPIPYNCKPLKSRMPAQLVNQGRETWKDLTLSGEQSEDAARQNVIQALYKFEELRQSFIEVEEARAAKGKAEGQAVRLRPDLRASVQMRIDGLRVNTNSIIGSVPGVHVGDHFWYRIEMVIVGLHQQLEAGIAFIGKSKSSSGMSFATSIVIKHNGNPYLDDEENGNIITYTGQGGLSHRSPTAHSVADQVLTRGNEALKNSFEHSKPIRVIRGHKDKKSPTTESYTYLGLYKALAMRYEPGVGGNLVYKFDLQRLEGQQMLPAPVVSQSHRESASIKGGPSSFKGKGSPFLEPQSHDSASFRGKDSPSFKGKGAKLQSGGSKVDKLSEGTLKWSKSEDVTNTAEVVHLKQKLHICIFDLVKNDGCKSPPLALTLVLLCVQKDSVC
ncbi:unnamed protein product [Sphagnum troendelagicum]|uniref:YDG domain-containing protein n=1 Tax=Sphagnum troendelagicum TaxID=128251 RepID=A0ABP0UTN8_9BRYO